MKHIIAAVALAAALSASAQSPNQDPASPLTVYAVREGAAIDQRITTDVVDAIAGDPRMTGTGFIRVQTDRGLVKLTGRVSTFLQADRAGEHAQSIKGVRDVDNQVNARVGKNF